MIFEKLSIVLFLFASAIDASAPNTDGVPEGGLPQPSAAEEWSPNLTLVRKILEKYPDLAAQLEREYSEKRRREDQPGVFVERWRWLVESKELLKKVETQSDTSDHDEVD
jgi:hypothetical protein